jgi:drug/metabolite transporter (DMT)-like permease
LLGVGFVASFLAIQTLYAGARRIGAAQAALVSTTEPVYIVVLSFLVLDQRLAPLQLVGAACVFIAVIVAQTSPRPRGAPEPATPLDAEVEG